MENATDALKMAAAVLIFVGALSLAILGFTKAKQAATAVLEKSDHQQYYSTENIRISNNRLVGIETVIPTLYSYFKEGYTILFYTGDHDENYDLVTNIKPLTLYYSEALPEDLAQSTMLNEQDTRATANFDADNNNVNEIYSRAVYGIDVKDETKRREPWLNDELNAKLFIQSLINNLGPTDPDAPSYDRSRATDIHTPNVLNGTKLFFSFDGFDGLTTRLGSSLSRATDALFVERIGAYNTITDYDSDEDLMDDSSVIEFSNNEVIQNDEGVQKRVIQYIYIGKRNNS